eukprot:3076494-Prymnesium_polylepis.2
MVHSPPRGTALTACTTICLRLGSHSWWQLGAQAWLNRETDANIAASPRPSSPCARCCGWPSYPIGSAFVSCSIGRSNHAATGDAAAGCDRKARGFESAPLTHVPLTVCAPPYRRSLWPNAQNLTARAGLRAATSVSSSA